MLTGKNTANHNATRQAAIDATVVEFGTRKEITTTIMMNVTCAAKLDDSFKPPSQARISSVGAMSSRICPLGGQIRSNAMWANVPDARPATHKKLRPRIEQPNVATTMNA